MELLTELDPGGLDVSPIPPHTAVDALAVDLDLDPGDPAPVSHLASLRGSASYNAEVLEAHAERVLGAALYDGARRQRAVGQLPGAPVGGYLLAIYLELARAPLRVATALPEVVLTRAVDVGPEALEAGCIALHELTVSRTVSGLYRATPGQ